MSAPAPSAPRLAATVLLLRDNPFEVLMIRRRAGETFGSALVFPGGVVDPEDWDAGWLARLSSGGDLEAQQRALRIAGLRELYEEAGVLAAAIDAPMRCVAGRPYIDAIGAARLDLDALVPFGHWITPEAAPRRFDTHFFLCAAPEGAEAMCDGDEAVALEWARPQDLLEDRVMRERGLLFSTRTNLSMLALSRSVAEALDRARAIPPMTVTPWVEHRPGGRVFRVPVEAGYPLSELAVPD